MTIELAGAWTRETLAPLRAALHAAIASRLPVCVAFDHVTHIDNAVIALLLLAFTPPGSRSALRLRGVSAPLAQVMYRHGAEFLLAEPATAERAHG